MDAEFHGEHAAQAGIRQAPVKASDHRAELDRIPAGENALRPATGRSHQRIGDPREFGELLLIGRIDQREPALLARRQQCGQGLKAIPAVNGKARVTTEFLRQQLCLARLDVADRGMVARAQQRRGDAGRSGVDPRCRRIGRIEAAHQLQVAADRRGQALWFAGGEPQDAARRLRCAVA